MSEAAERTAEIPVGVVIRKQPGVTRWAKWVWRVVGVLPGAPPADWRELRREGEAVEYHAATVTLEVHRAETEGYKVALSNEPPCLYVVLRPAQEAVAGQPLEVFAVTASAYDAERYLDSGEDIVEAVPMPPAVIAWLSEFVARHHKERRFVKRKRMPAEARDACDTGPRVRQAGDVFARPASRGGRRKPQ